ncbi:hypothetical protein CGMCC3_g16392 [Colletotrichum fructicola]|nr:uncharacterized protein CGMCC3_g16392 [Colletotrichum fructicola]KAE9567440.1 hypothetical protein CGMCC3_g16392 [Colletotrichum fructicola]
MQQPPVSGSNQIVVHYRNVPRLIHARGIWVDPCNSALIRISYRFSYRYQSQLWDVTAGEYKQQPSLLPSRSLLTSSRPLPNSNGTDGTSIPPAPDRLRPPANFDPLRCDRDRFCYYRCSNHYGARPNQIILHERHACHLRYCAAIAGFHASVHNKWVMLEFHLVSSQDHLFVSDYGAGWVAHQKAGNPHGVAGVPETMTDAYWRAAGIVPPANMAESPTREPQE